jgi:hypothetical protein
LYQYQTLSSAGYARLGAINAESAAGIRTDSLSERKAKLAPWRTKKSPSSVVRTGGEFTETLKVKRFSSLALGHSLTIDAVSRFDNKARMLVLAALSAPATHPAHEGDTGQEQRQCGRHRHHGGRGEHGHGAGILDYK